MGGTEPGEGRMMGGRISRAGYAGRFVVAEGLSVVEPILVKG